MSNNLLIDEQAFVDGFNANLRKSADITDYGVIGGIKNGLNGVGNFVNKHLSAGGGGLRDSTWESAKGGLKDLGGALGEGMGKGTVDGAVTGVKDQVGGFMDKAKQYGQGLLDNPMKTIQDNPWTSAGLGAGILGAGYFGGKALGLWGGDDNDNRHHAYNGQQMGPMASNGYSPPPPMMQSAYTPGYTPMALSKAGESLPLPSPLMSRLNPSISLGSSIYNAVNRNNLEEATEPKQVVINPQDERVNKLLKNPKMQAYLTSLVNSTYTR